MTKRFVDVGAPAHLAATWFAALFQDGCALTAAACTAPFAQVVVGVLCASIGQPASQPHHRLGDQRIMGGFDELRA